MALSQKQYYTIADIYALPDGQRAELIDGQIYHMVPPSTTHQRILKSLVTKIDNYIQAKKGSYEVFPAPFAVFLNKDGRSYLEPDISVICNPDKLDDKGCHGAPDWIIEIISPSNSIHDYINKLALYKLAGVREYWIVDPGRDMILVYFFEEATFHLSTHTFQSKIKVNIYDDLSIDFREIHL